ncbi:Kinase suppressor of Ras 1 [Dissostichus eleginoides]|uniref:Kinase suppressor of Ras 1 n=1 Tax=Dissostichus eleginoides TaxID=100907 RepID=A0AAD9CE22_DISEL|nr:Kinase suppressor of Ras 1 [Dissostichus eleginoides]
MIFHPYPVEMEGQHQCLQKQCSGYSGNSTYPTINTSPRDHFFERDKQRPPDLRLSLSCDDHQAAAGKLSLDGSLQNSSCELQDTMRRLGSSSEDRPRLTGALSCLKSANEAGV